MKQFSYTYDEKKRMVNQEKHGLDFADFAEVVTTGELRCQTVTVNGDVRIVGIGMFRNRATLAVFQNRDNQVRMISWRKANKREQKLYREHGAEWMDFDTAFAAGNAKSSKLGAFDRHGKWVPIRIPKK